MDRGKDSTVLSSTFTKWPIIRCSCGRTWQGMGDCFGIIFCPLTPAIQRCIAPASMHLYSITPFEKEIILFFFLYQSPPPPLGHQCAPQIHSELVSSARFSVCWKSTTSIGRSVHLSAWQWRKKDMVYSWNVHTFFCFFWALSQLVSLLNLLLDWSFFIDWPWILAQRKME